MRKQFLACLLAILLCVNLITPAKAASAPTFSDVPRNHWAYEAIETMAAQGSSRVLEMAASIQTALLQGSSLPQ